MATAESVKNKIQGLIDTANATTGGSAADLTTAIDLLVAGFSSDEDGVKAIIRATSASSTALGTRVNVDFGFTPDFILVMVNTTVTPVSGRAYPLGAWGFTSAAAEALGVDSTQYYMATSGTNVKTANTGWTVDGNDNSGRIYGVDATGFNLGGGAWASTSLIVFAIGGLT